MCIACSALFRHVLKDIRGLLSILHGHSAGVMGSGLGLVGPVSVYCDWVRQKVGSITSTSVWQHIFCLSRSVPEIYTLACCWDATQPADRPTPASPVLHSTVILTT